MSRSQERGATNVSFERGDIYGLEFPDNNFDAVWTSSLMQWPDKPARAICEVLRVLKPGGVYASGDRNLFGNANRLLLRALNLHSWQNELASGGSFRFGGRLRGTNAQSRFRKRDYGCLSRKPR